MYLNTVARQKKIKIKKKDIERNMLHLPNSNIAYLSLHQQLSNNFVCKKMDIINETIEVHQIWCLW